MTEIDELKSALNNKLSLVLRHLLPKGKFWKNKFYVGDVSGNRGRSLVVELSGSKIGIWHDFATGAGGNILGLWAAVNRLDIKHDYSKVISSIRSWLGITKQTAKQETSTTKWDYLSESGEIIATVYRSDTASGKQFRPYDAKTGKYKAPEIRPLYNLPGIKLSSFVVLVEGEKSAQALIDVGVCATTAMNGASAPIDKTDWSPLHKKNILIWPDNDAIGKKYANLVVQRLKAENPYAIAMVNIPESKPPKWDAADAVAGSVNINALLRNKTFVVPPPAPFYSGGHAIDKKDPGPDDLVLPSVLTEGGLCVIGGAPKTGKSDFLLHWLIHMSMGLDFIGMKPSRPLRVAYIQVEIRYHAICKRVQSAIQSMNIEPELLHLFRKNLFFTPHMRLTLDAEGVELIRRTILYYFDNKVDVIAFDPLRYIFDGGKNDKTENDNGAMRLFLQERMDVLRDAVNPNAANILVHHTKKIDREQLEEEGFQALSGASALHGYFSSGVLMYRPNKQKPYRKLIFELRDGEPIESKYIQKVDGIWCEVKHELPSFNKEPKQNPDAILQIIYDEANKGNVYTINQFCEEFKADFGSIKTLSRKVNELIKSKRIKFFDSSKYGLLGAARSKYGHLYVENMKLRTTTINKETGEIISHMCDIDSSHVQCKSDSILDSEESKNWEDFNEKNS